MPDPHAAECQGTDGIPCTPDFTCLPCVARELGVDLSADTSDTPPASRGES